MASEIVGISHPSILLGLNELEPYVYVPIICSTSIFVDCLVSCAVKDQTAYWQLWSSVIIVPKLSVNCAEVCSQRPRLDYDKLMTFKRKPTRKTSF